MLLSTRQHGSSAPPDGSSESISSVLEEPSLALHAARIAAQRAVVPDDAMTRHDD